MSGLLSNPDAGSSGGASSSRSPTVAASSSTGDRFEDDLELDADELSQPNGAPYNDVLDGA
jgi:hypothetical protein